MCSSRAGRTSRPSSSARRRAGQRPSAARSRTMTEPQSGTWTIRRVLGWTAQYFEKKGVDAPRLTAEVLLAHALATTRVRLYVDLDRPLEPAELKSFRALIE